MWHVCLIALTLVGLMPISCGSYTQCRCTTVACLNHVPFHTLNFSIGGRLIQVTDEMNGCLVDGMASTQCSHELNQTDHEFFYTGQVGGYLHSGLYDSRREGEPGWNISHNLSVFAVAAESEEDVQAGITFAVKHNLRLVVKNTGHDWFGRSGAHPDLENSLMIWMHKLKNMSWNDDRFIPAMCSEAEAINNTVTLGAGIQFADLYPVAEQRGRLVNGGTCTSVGMAGCLLGGCFGSFSQALGSAASNLVQAKVVLANGSLVKVSQCSHADLFWALRGGGGGFGVITEFTFRTYPSPSHITYVEFHGSVGQAPANPDSVQRTAVEVLRAADHIAGVHGGWNGGWKVPTVQDPEFSVSLSTYNGNETAGRTMLEGIAAWAQSQGHPFSGSISSHTAVRPIAGWAVPGAPEGQVSLPWDDPHHDTEIGTEHLVSMSKWITRKALHEGPGDTGLNKVARALVNLSTIATSGMLKPLPTGVSTDMAKAQGGASAHAVNLFQDTAQNPVLLDTVGFVTSQWRIPSVPQLKPSAQLLQTLWPRMQKYAITSKQDVLFDVCETGANGNTTSAEMCFSGWSARVPLILAELNILKDELWRQFRPTRDGIHSWSGSYWNEADYYEPEWQSSFWGAETYANLFAVKEKYDTYGLFACHHCVGSEKWDDTGNCPI